MKNLLTFIKDCFTDGWKFAREQYTPAKTSVTKVSLDEIIFQNREKEYGAYMLRKNHNWYLATALAFACSVFLYAALLPVFLGLMKEDTNEKEQQLVNELSGICFPILRLPPDSDQLRSGKKVKVYFQIPKPALEEEEKNKFSGKGKDYINSVEEIHEYTSNLSAPDTIIPISRNYDLSWPGLDTTSFYPRYRFYEDDEIPEVCICDEEYPDHKEFVFVEAEPIPINSDELTKCIKIPHSLMANLSSWEGSFVFRVLVDKRGNYKKHIVLNDIHGLEKVKTEIENCLPILKFTPAIQGDRPIPFWVNIPFNIKLL